MTSLNLVRFGHGERVFLGFPGWGADYQRSFQTMLPYIPDDVSFFLLDLPGLGLSPGLSAPPHQWRWDDASEVLAQVIDQLYDMLGHRPPVTLVGSCSGSFNAMEVAIRRPDDVHAIVMLEPFSRFPWFLRALVLPKLGPLLYQIIFANSTTRNALLWVLRQSGVMGEFNPFETWERFDPWVIYAHLKLYQEVEDTLGGAWHFCRVSAPTCIVTGSDTFSAIRDTLHVWDEILDGVEIRRIAGVGHQITQDAAEETAALTFRPLQAMSDHAQTQHP